MAGAPGEKALVSWGSHGGGAAAVAVVTGDGPAPPLERGDPFWSPSPSGRGGPKSEALAAGGRSGAESGRRLSAHPAVFVGPRGRGLGGSGCRRSGRPVGR